MKLFSASILFLFLSLSLFSKGLDFQEKTTLFKHLCEVNQQWNMQKDIPKAFFNKAIHFDNDIQRIQTHLKYVEQILRNRNTNHLSATQKSKRLHHLDVLHNYWQASTFPINTFHSHRQPYFVDIFGMHCAVGYLLQQDSQDAFIEEIRAKDNYAYIHELTKYSELDDWAKANGFTIDELALIQPGYTPPAQNYLTVGGNGGVNGKIHTMKVSPDSSIMIIAGSFSTVDGVSSHGVIGWTANSTWQTYGQQINGQVYDVIWEGNNLIAVGNFKIGITQVNIARWNGSTWQPLQSGDMQGAIYTAFYAGGMIHIGGDFQKVNGVTMPYLAYLPNGSSTWSNNGGFQNTDADAFSVNGPVRNMIFTNNQLLIGGHFTQTAPNASNTNHQLTANGLAYWNSDTWVQSVQCCLTKVNTMLKYKDTLFVAGHIDDAYGLAMFESGSWTDLNSQDHFSAWDDGYFTHFLRYYNRVFLIGNFQLNPGWGYFSNSIIQVTPYLLGFQIPDKPITAAVRFRDKVYFGGDFTTFGGATFNQLAASYLGNIPSSINNLSNEQPSKVFSYDNQIVIEHNQSTIDSFILYDISGKVVLEKQLQGNQREIISTQHLTMGVYFYQLLNESNIQTGKLGIF